MASSDEDEVPMLSVLATHTRLSNDNQDSQFQKFISRTQSASTSIPMNPIESYEGTTNLEGHTGPLWNERRIPFLQMSGPLYIRDEPQNSYVLNQGGVGYEQVKPKVENSPSFNEMEMNVCSDDNNASRNEYLLRSGHLGMCNDPYHSTCQTYYEFNTVQTKHSKPSAVFEPKFHNALYGDAKGWAGRFTSFLHSYVPGIINPHAKVVQQWNQFFVISFLVAIFVDLLCFILLSFQKDNKCLVIDWPKTIMLVVFKSMTDLIYLLNILLQFRLAYIAPESRVIGAGEFVDHPKKISINYLRGYFLIDFFAILPLPQLVILRVIPEFLAGANYARILLCAAFPVQYILRLCRFLPLLAGQSPSGIIFESAWANFIINLLMYVLSGHIVGTFWYLFGLKRVNQCLQDACISSGIKDCMEFLECGNGNTNHGSKVWWANWTSNDYANACFTKDGFNYGIYVRTVQLTTHGDIITRYIYSLYWGIQAISTLAGNLTPNYHILEVLFTMTGVLLFALLVGNIGDFLQALSRRSLEMSIRCRDVEQWMSHRRFSEGLRRRVREAERYNYATTRGVNEEILLENLPEDLQRDIKRHLFKFVKKVRIFALMDDPILDAIYERLQQKIYIKESRVFCPGGLIDKMVFIVRGKMESIGEDGIRVPLAAGDVCGEELLTWCLEHSTVNRGTIADGKTIRIPGQQLLSNRMVWCLTNVEAFSLQVADLQEVTSLFSRFLCSPRVRGAIRYESPYWRSLAATRIQVAWRYRKKRQSSRLSK